MLSDSWTLKTVKELKEAKRKSHVVPGVLLAITRQMTKTTTPELVLLTTDLLALSQPSPQDWDVWTEGGRQRYYCIQLLLQKVFLLFHVCRCKETKAQMTVTRPVNHSGLHHVSLAKREIGLSCLNHFLKRILIYKIDKTGGANWRGLGVQPTPQSPAPQPRLCSFRLKQQLFLVRNLGFKSC